jgi:hypothetical protein
MAEIVQSLFGITPDMYQQSQQARADQQALQYAQLTPFQQANFAIGRGANMLGGAIGGALGGQDPQLALISARQQISGQINYADPESIAKGVDMLSRAGDTQGAMMLSDVYRKAESERALTAQRTAQAGRERQQAIPNDILIANEIATLTDAQDQLLNQPASPERDRAINLLTTRLTQLERLTTKEKTQPKTSYGPEADRAAFARFGKNFSDLTQTEAAVIDTLLEERGVKKAKEGAPKLTNVMPGQKEFADIPKFRADVQKTIAPQIQSVTAADQALQAINDSITKNNFVSFNAARVQLAKALGDSQLSRRDVEQAGGDPSLFGRLLDSTSTLFTGTPTVETQNLIKNTLTAIKKVSKDKANREIDVQRNIAYNTPGYDRARVDAALTFPEFAVQPVGVTTDKKPVTRTLKSGKVVTVIEE